MKHTRNSNMGIIEENLTEFDLSTFDDCYIERNADGSIHLHLDALRIEMSRREFNQFTAAVQNARGELRRVKANDEPHEDTTANSQ